MKSLMATKKDKILNLVVDSRYKEILRTHAEAKGVSISQIIRDFVDKQLVADPDHVKVILNIPNDICKEESKLKAWLNLKMQVLENHLKNVSH